LTIIYNKVKLNDNTNFIRNQISVAGRIINKIDKLLSKYEQIIDISYIEMLYKQSSSEMTINLKGDYDGLQIMGLLETRNLDFKTVHILSVNEGILPQSKMLTV
jgi:inactivated superfamily I helicase